MYYENNVFIQYILMSKYFFSVLSTAVKIVRLVEKTMEMGDDLNDFIFFQHETNL